MDKVYDMFKVIDGVLCKDGKALNLDQLAAKLNNQCKIIDEVAEKKIQWAKEDKESAKRGKIAHEAFMEKMEARKAKAKKDHELRMAKSKETHEAGLEFIDRMDIDLTKLRERMKAAKK